MSAYEIQKLVEYRNIFKWVKISTPSIYKKTIQLEEKGLISGTDVKAGKMPEKAVYALTDAGEKENIPEIPETGMAIIMTAAPFCTPPSPLRSLCPEHTAVH